MFSVSCCLMYRMDREQFSIEILPLYGQLFSHARRMIGNTEDAEDIVQEVFLKLWRMRDDLERYDNVGALSAKMTRNLCLNRIKAVGRRPQEAQGGVVAETGDSPHTRLEERENLDRTMRIIDGLPELQRTVLRMKHVGGYEVNEIALITGSSAEAVRMNLSRARKRVRDIFFNKKT